MDYETDKFEGDLWQNTLVITCKLTGTIKQVSLKTNGRASTKREFKSCIKSHGLERAFETFWKLGV